MTTPLDKVTRVQGTVRCPSVDRLHLAQALTKRAFTLPDSHLELLSSANGLTVYNGYFRLFGITCNQCVDLFWWNDFDTWKFAWNKDLSRFLCFGETAWGDQYAYDREARGAEVYFLDALRMEPEIIAGNFDEFAEKEFVRCASEPYDEILVTASKVIGPLAWPQHITYLPSPLLSGTEVAENVEKMNARASMIANGDLATQCGHETWSRQIASLESYVDSRGRPRLRVKWS